ncbi:hypothetical protein BDY21DRAFT_379092 [Lineolata rhizophorae]|uniref:Uncharacterized protein n=1 Tax=Lineolata rhizophorae TaxID=578093 RepID=A0A6A6P223_9PEZI|nr:hypothetical protein BDY21DRAFT_379092 [Lineolata rhizophorae]
MESPSPKRRRLSAAPPRPSASAQTGTSARASFASPTRASLARFNPSLLPRPRSAGNPAPATPDKPPRARSDDALAYVLASHTANPHADPEADPANGRASAERATGADAIEGEPARTAVGTPRRSAVQGRFYERFLGEVPDVERDDEELPPTPSEPGSGRRDGASPSGSVPRGMLFSSPSRRPKRGKGRDKGLGASPLRPRVQPTKGAAEADSGTSGAASNFGGKKAEAVASRPEGQAVPSAIKPAAMGEAVLDPRFKEKEKLERELRVLQEEVNELEKEAELSRSGQSGAIGDDNIDTLMSLLVDDATDAASTSAQNPPLSLSQALNAFLPFSLLPQPRISAAPPSSASTDEDSDPLPSHDPVDLPEPIPYLTLFTPFTFTSETSLSGTISPTQQIQHLTLRSPGALLTARLELAIERAGSGGFAGGVSVASLKVESLPAWARREVGAWLDDVAESDRDINRCCWALERYWDVCVRRAECWVRCERAWPGLVAETREKSAGAGAREGGAMGKGKGKRERVDEEGNEDSDEEAPEEERVQLSKTQLKEQLGRTTLVLGSEQVVLRVSWKVGCAWTGDAMSSLKADVALPRTWSEADDRGAFKRVPAAFERLVEDRGVFEAIKVLIGLLFTK